MMTVGASQAVAARPQVWPLSVQAYHVLGEMGLIPEKTELLYGQVFHDMPKSPFHRLLLMRLLELIRNALPPGLHVQPEQPLSVAIQSPNQISRSLAVRSTTTRPNTHARPSWSSRSV
jgi:hypothetical protein